MPKKYILLAAVSLSIAVIVIGFSSYYLLSTGRFTVPQGGMAPTILAGSELTADKLAYSKASDVKYGDIAIYESEDSKYVYIWRVVGLPGDRLIVDSGSLIRNDNPIYGDKVECEPELDPEQYECFMEADEGVSYKIAMEILPQSNADLRINFGPVTVPDGEFFMLGDCRNCARDSRMTGTVKFSQIVGKAEL